MIEIPNRSISKIEEVLEFYNRYLALDNDEQYILNIVNNLAKIFILKVTPKTDKFDILDINGRFEITDLSFFSPFERKCINFWTAASIKIDENLTAFVDRYGTIVTFNNNEDLEMYVGKHIFEFLNDLPHEYENARQDAKNVIIQNVLACKLYKAIAEKIEELKGPEYANLFKKINRRILSYERDLIVQNQEKNIDIIGYPRIKSSK